MNGLFPILHEDADLLVLHKPAGLVCHPTKGEPTSSLIGRVRLHLGSDGAPQMVNRLDRETSGLVVCAKHAEAARTLRRLWGSGLGAEARRGDHEPGRASLLASRAMVDGTAARQEPRPTGPRFRESRAVQKVYLAIVHGWPSAEEGLIEASLGRDTASPVAIKDCVRPDGAPAQTRWQVLTAFTRGEGRFSLLRVEPLTGRKHQIRIHLAHVGHPVVGDKIYGGDELAYLAFVERRLEGEQRARLLLANHALHAAELNFEWRGTMRHFGSPPETEFREFLPAWPPAQP